MSQLTPLDYLKSIDADSGDAFRVLRQAVAKSGPLDPKTVELIVLGGLVTAGNKRSFGTHAKRLIQEKVPAAALRQAVLVTLGASTNFNQVLNALEWVDEIVAEG